MDIVSFETAKRLKEAGFPQPQPAFGQAWYADAVTVFIVVEVFIHPLAHYAWIIERGGEVDTVDHNVFENMTFAPTAPDILLELSDGIALHRVNDNMFYCGKELLPGFTPCLKNAAEAAAHYWLFLYGEKPNLSKPHD